LKIAKMSDSSLAAIRHASATGSRGTIAVVVPALDQTGGVSSVAAFLSRTIRRHSTFDIRFFSLAASASDPCNVLLHRPATWFSGVQTRVGTFHGEPFVHIGASLGEFEFRRLAPGRKLHRLLADCDLVQVVSGAPAFVLPVVGCGKPVVLQVATLTSAERVMRDRDPSSLVDHWRRLMTRITVRYDEVGLRAVNAVMVENPWMLDYAQKAAAGSKIIVKYAPPGVDTETFCPALSRCNNDERAYVLAVGRFCDPRKNPNLLLDTFARLQTLLRDPPRLVIAGSSDPGPLFWARVAALGLEDRIALSLQPSVEALADLYRNALCLALTSDEEGFGMVVIEAMASGTPVVATRCGGPDGIITEGKDGFLVDKGDAEAFARRVALLASNASLNQEMGRKARLTVEERYSEQVAGRAFLEIYEFLLSDRVSRRAHGTSACVA
jgi:D-inositol-3-phosphate glycosyltransferase